MVLSGGAHSTYRVCCVGTESWISAGGSRNRGEWLLLLWDLILVGEANYRLPDVDADSTNFTHKDAFSPWCLDNPGLRIPPSKKPT